MTQGDGQEVCYGLYNFFAAEKERDLRSLSVTIKSLVVYIVFYTDYAPHDWVYCEYLLQ